MASFSLALLAHFLLAQVIVQPAAVIRIKLGGRITLIVDLGDEITLIEAAIECCLEIEHRFPVIAGERQTEFGQLLLQCSSIDLIALGMGGASDRNGVVPFWKPF